MAPHYVSYLLVALNHQLALRYQKASTEPHLHQPPTEFLLCMGPAQVRSLGTSDSHSSGVSNPTSANY